MPIRHPTDELLRCVLMECESIVNSRPLTFVPIDTEADEALTPNHFLLGTSSGIKDPGPYTDDVLILKKKLEKKLKIWPTIIGVDGYENTCQ